MRRKPGTLLPIEVALLRAGIELRLGGEPEFHGYMVASKVAEGGGGRLLTAHGTLYKALGRLEEFGLLSSRWEDAPAVEGRPRRRLYELTGEGSEVAENLLNSTPGVAARRLASEPA